MKPAESLHGQLQPQHSTQLHHVHPGLRLWSLKASFGPVLLHVISIGAKLINLTGPELLCTASECRFASRLTARDLTAAMETWVSWCQILSGTQHFLSQRLFLRPWMFRPLNKKTMSRLFCSSSFKFCINAVLVYLASQMRLWLL